MAVRNESVRVSLEDAGVSTGFARMAAAAALFEHQLDDLDGTNVDTARNLRVTSREVDNLGGSFRRNDSDLNQFTGRLGLARDAILTLGPALVPIGAVAIPAVTGLASAFGFAAIGAGTAIAAFQGVGDALKAVNKAQLEPTTANIMAARDAMQQISVPARDFVRELTEMGPALRAVRDAAADGLFSELTPALDDLEDALPRVAGLFEVVGEAVGRLGADAIESLTGPEWEDFFAFIQAEAPQALSDLGAAIGSLSHGFAELWIAFGPLNRDFNGWLRDAAEGFDKWAQGLSQTQGFNDFVDYIRENGPRVAKALGSLSNAFVQVVQAAAPLGGPVLDAITGFANAVATLADSPLGTPLFTLAAGLAAVSRAGRLLDSAAIGTAGLSKSLTRLTTTGPAAVLLIGTISDTLSQMDSLKRSSELTDTFADSVDELTVSLSQSNVGKWAEDLGIDIDRLAEDLVRNGESGAYASAVLDQLSESSHGVGAALNSLGGNILPFYTANADKAYDANKDLRQSIENMTPGHLTTALPWLADAVDRLGGKTRDTADAFREGADAARTFSDALLEFSGWLDRQQALRNYETAVRDLGKALKDGFQPKDKDNILAVAGAIEQVASQITDKGKRADFLEGAIKSLENFAGKGPLAADALKPLLKQLDELDNFGPVEPPIGMNDRDFRAKARNVMADLSRIDQQKPTPKADLDTGLFTRKGNTTTAWLDQFDREHPTAELDADPSGVLRGVSAAQAALRAIDGTSVTTYIATVHTPKAQGGYIAGPGGPTDDRIPAMLSNGEFVMKAAAVQRYGIDAMYAMNEMRLAAGGLVNMTHAKRFANGGSVSGFDATFVAADISRGIDSIFVPWQAIMRQELRAAKELAEARRDEADAIRENRNALRDASRSFKDAIRDQFSGSDLFGAEGASFASVFGGLKQEEMDASTFDRLRLRLGALGLGGPALEALLGSVAQTGNLGLLQDFASQSSADLAAFQAQFGSTQQRALQSGVGGSFQVFGDRIADLTDRLAKADERADRAERRAEQADKRAERQRERGIEATKDVSRNMSRVAGRALRRP